MKGNEQDIPDAQVRQLAETTFDRNVVVVAGAGTGKTTLLVNRLVHLLMREPHPVEVTKLVALTFTNKAATEMKLRLRDRLLVLLNAETSGRGDPGAVTAADLRGCYGLTNAEIVARADAALGGLEKAQIGTLHSFAAHLLRLYPLESGVDPGFQTDDDESRFQEHFAAQWDLWLDRELALHGPQELRWRRLLSGRGLEPLREMAYALRSELIPLDELQRQTESGVLPPALRDWFASKRDRAAALLASRKQAKRLKADAMLEAARDLFALLLEHGVDGLARLPPAQRQELGRDVGKKTAGWSEEDFTEAEGLIKTAQQACAVAGALTADLLALLCPFVQQVRATFLDQGWVSFDGLLARARALLRDHPAIRERLKHEYQAVLVDEFQDTDPVQYEIILYLAERAGRQGGGDWRAVELEQGKLFIVGDPKQSIYAFRRADIEAFERVVEKVAASGGITYALSTNFRSDERVLEVVNPLFDRLLIRQDHIQPANVPLIVRPNRPSRTGRPGVEVRVARAGDDEEATSQSATRHEAEQLARWLKDELLANETLTEASGRKDRLKPGHIALLFRKLTQAQEYLDALRRHGVAYITDGEKHFYKRQEVIDLVNVLRVVENPHDEIALAGILRSPLGGVTDRELVALRERGAFDYRHAARLSGWKSPCAEAVRLLYARLAGLHRSLPAVPLPEAIDRLFDGLPILELAAASLHGEQAVANLMKVRQMAVELAGRPHLTFTAFVELMIARLDEQPEEAESALAEESLDAVRVLTIHKAKGLEFPVVVLPGFHHGTSRGHDLPPVSHDWATGVFGINWGECCNLGAVLVNEKVRLREEAERRRLFYVGMTRAKERLILSGGWPGPASRSKGTFLDLLREAATGGIGDADVSSLRVGPVSLEQTVVTSGERAPKRRKAAPARLRASKEWASVAERWKARDQAWNTMRATAVHVTPTGLLKSGEGKTRPASHTAGDPDRSRLVGTLVHRVLQHWDFSGAPEISGERIAAVCRRDIAEGQADMMAEIERELQELLRTFAASGPYRELQRATILGREVPFVMPWPAAGTRRCLMEGAIDVVYRLDGKIHLADYKTDRVQDSEIQARAAAYEGQARVYREALSRCLGITDVGVRLIFVRNGKAVSL